MRRLETPPTLADGTGPRELLARAVPLRGTPGEAYVERRGVPVSVAEDNGVRFDPSVEGRAGVVVAMVDPGGVRAAHVRYLEVPGRLDKMRTVGSEGGVVEVGDGWRDPEPIVVEGLFDALSLAACGWSAVATIGRWAPFLVEATAGRRVWLALDATRPGEAEVARIAARLAHAEVRRMRPPDRCKDWSTALVKRGRTAVGSWVKRHREAG